MCLARPLNRFDTTNWEVLDARDNIEILMDEVFEEKDKWKEGDYLKYLDILKHFWEDCENWLLPKNCARTIEKMRSLWYESGHNTGPWRNSKWFEVAPALADTMIENANTLLVKMSVITYFTKLCSRYNTRKFIKKIKLPTNTPDGQLEVGTFTDSMVVAQKLIHINPDDVGKQQPEFTTDDGKKRYVWRRQDNHLLFDMENIDYK